ncbi:short-chain dehydrogenase, partial [Arthrospira sp. O9.13F]
MTQLENATVVLTGATGGFGQQLTRQLLAAGSRLILSDRHQPTLHQ